MAEVTLTLEEYEALREMAMGIAAPIVDTVIVKPVKRKASAASKKVAPKFKLKNGSWKKNGFKMAVRAAHKLAKTNRKL